MRAIKSFTDYTALIELIAGVAGSNRTESLTLRNSTGRAVGLLTVENGMVRFGVEFLGRVFLDNALLQEAPRLVMIVQKILDRQSLAKAERELIAELSPLARASLLGATARALRKLSTIAVLPKVPRQSVDLGLPQLRILNVAFSPAELFLAAGSWGAPRPDDGAVQMYQTPPAEPLERWLFEWQPSEAEGAWPILTTHIGVRTVRSIADVTTATHRLLSHFMERRRKGDRWSKRALALRLTENVLYTLSTSRYLTTLLFDGSQYDRVQQQLEQLTHGVMPVPRRLEPLPVRIAKVRPPATLAGQELSSEAAPPVPAIPSLEPEVFVEPIGTSSVEPAGEAPGTSFLPPATAWDAKSVVTVAAPAIIVIAPATLPVVESAPAASSVVESAPAAPPIAEPAPVEPPIAEPAPVAPPIAEPAPAASSVVESAPVAPSVVESASVEPPIAEPAPVMPSVVESAPIEPPIAEPAPVMPSVLESAPVEPSIAEPASVAPSVVESAPIEPPTAEPAPAAPAVIVVAPTPEVSRIKEEEPPLSDEAAWLAAAEALPSLPEELWPAGSERSSVTLEPASPPPVTIVHELPPVLQLAPSEVSPTPPVSGAIEEAHRIRHAPSFETPPPRRTQPLLELENFSAYVAGRTILKNLTLSIGERGVYAVMGPGGSGKSSLLGVLSGKNGAGSGWSFDGKLLLHGAPLGVRLRPLVIEQNIAPVACTLREYLYQEIGRPSERSEEDAQLCSILQRVMLPLRCGSLDEPLATIQPALTQSERVRLLMAAKLLADPPLLCVDEPTAFMSDQDAAPILDLLKLEGLIRSVLFITHNQQHARACSHYTILLAGGQLQERQSTEMFFTSPISKAAQDYARSGGCHVPFPDAQPEHLADEFQDGAAPGEGEDPSARDAESSLAAVAIAPELILFKNPEEIALVEVLASTEASVEASAEAPAEAPVTLPAAAPTASVIAPESESPREMAPERAEPAPSEVIFAARPGESAAVLCLRGFSVRVGHRQIVSGIHMDLPALGLFVVGANEGAEKRVLLRALSSPQPGSFHLDGVVSYGGRPLADGHRPKTSAIAAQHLMHTVADYLAGALDPEGAMTKAEQRARCGQLLRQSAVEGLSERLSMVIADLDLVDRRVIEILGAAASAPALLLIDDPLAGLDATARATVLRILTKQAKQRCLLVFAQNVAPYAEVQSGCAFLVEGKLAPQAPPPPEEPAAAVAPVVIASTVASAAPPAEPTASAPEPAAAAPTPTRSLGKGPRGFQWLREGSLAGMPAPGVTHDLSYDLQLIRGAGIQCLVTLTLEPLPAEALAEAGLRCLFCPIVDMDAPTEVAAAALCADVESELIRGNAIGFHCKAGLGRTGTMLAAQLIWQGESGATALTRVRAVEPQWVQSEKQVAFLLRFEKWLQSTGRSPAASPRTPSAGQSRSAELAPEKVIPSA